MYVTVLDTNVLRGLPPDEFSKLEAAELRNGVRQYADLWTLMELIAHLRSPTDADYRSCRMALRRCANRALLPADQAPRMLAPSEQQISRLVFGEPLRDQEDNVAAFVELARGIAMADVADDLGGFRDGIQLVADHVSQKERWFAEYFENLREQVYEATKSVTNSERNKAVRAWTRSDAAIRMDAEALVRRAFSQAEREVPHQIPPHLIDCVLAASRPGSWAVALLLERIICDNTDLGKLRHRNLMWDQEVSASVGQSVDGLPIIVVTSDSYFGETAGMAGHRSAVCTPDEYLAKLEMH
jgi:hypothetical protein